MLELEAKELKVKNKYSNKKTEIVSKENGWIMQISFISSIFFLSVSHGH